MLRDLLKENIVMVTFTKKNGEEREMLCTLREEFLPEVSGDSTVSSVVTVYDLENQGWRSFREDSVIDYYLITKDVES